MVIQFYEIIQNAKQIPESFISNLKNLVEIQITKV